MSANRTRNNAVLAFHAIRLIGRRLPPIPHSTALINRVLRPLYLRRPRDLRLSSWDSSVLILDPREELDARLLFMPQLFERRELAFLGNELSGGDVFLDAGAHIGAYTLFAARRVGTAGRVLAVEPDPLTSKRLREHVELNGFSNVVVRSVGLSSQQETLGLHRNLQGNTGGNRLIPLGSPNASDKVRCEPLYDLLLSEGVTSLDGAKFDLEGFEFRVLARFFRDAPESMWPNYAVCEVRNRWPEGSLSAFLDLWVSRGYRVVDRTIDNVLLIKEPY